MQPCSVGVLRKCRNSRIARCLDAGIESDHHDATDHNHIVDHHDVVFDLDHHDVDLDKLYVVNEQQHEQYDDEHNDHDHNNDNEYDHDDLQSQFW